MSEKDTIEVKTRLQRRRVLRMSYNVSQTDGRKVATIRVSGAYLEDIGFKHDEFFEMIINQDGSLTIRPHSGKDKKNEEAVKDCG